MPMRQIPRCWPPARGASSSAWGLTVAMSTPVYKNGAGNIAYRKYLPEKGWDTAETVPDTSSADDYPSVRADDSDGQVDVGWTRHAGTSSGDQTRHFRVKSARPAINQLANTGIADPSTSTTANVISTLNDDKSPSLTGSTTVLDSQGNTVRTLFSGSEVRGAQSVVWDGRTVRATH